MQYIGLMDCNNFFVSCERLFRPDLNGKPVAVLSPNDGCIIARSEEVKDIGIPMGIPYFKAADVCKREHITVFSSNAALYRDISRRVMSVLEDMVENMEVYSIDEAFFEIRTRNVRETARCIQHNILKSTGIPVSLGLGSTKTIAKAATRYAKKGSGVCVFDAVSWEQVVHELSCGSIWGIGRRSVHKLERDGVHTVEDFVHKGISYARNNFGVIGERMYLELTGVSVYRVNGVHDPVRKSLSSERSFRHTVSDKAVLESALGHHISSLGEKLRTRKWVTSRLRISIAPHRFGDFALRRSARETLFCIPTADTKVLLKEALKLLTMIYEDGVPYKKIGVVVSGIRSAESVQPSFFDTTETKDTGELYKTIDRLNALYGKGTIHSGIIYGEEKWHERSEQKSDEYTTAWKDIRKVQAR